jgi:hypothetical protein
MEKFLTPEMTERVAAMTFDERNDFWYNEYRTYILTLPIPALLTLSNSADDIRFSAQAALMSRMEEAGLRGGITPCCGNKYEWKDTAAALSHIKSSPCPMGFQIIDGKCVCDCKKKCDTPELAKAHQIKIGICLHERKRLQKLFCVVCEHQSETKKQHEEHLASKTHHKTANPVNLTCDVCKVVCRTKKEFDRHCAGKQHIYKADPSHRPNYTCSCCKITCSTQKQFDAHQQTNKHTKNMENYTNASPS